MADNIATLRAALGRIGWTPAAQNSFTSEGFATIADVGLVTREFLGKVCKKIRTGRTAVAVERGQPAAVAIRPEDIPLFNEFKLFALHLWVCEKNRQGQEILPEDFTAVVANEYTARVRNLIEEKDCKIDEMVKLPGNFDKDTDWVQFKKLLINYLGSKLGKNRAPLSYCTRENDDIPHPDDVPDFENEHERLEIMTPHAGEAFAKDNGQLWSILKQLTLAGPAYAYISSFDRTRNGRGALKALIGHYE